MEFLAPSKSCVESHLTTPTLLTTLLKPRTSLGSMRLVNYHDTKKLTQAHRVMEKKANVY